MKEQAPSSAAPTGPRAATDDLEPIQWLTTTDLRFRPPGTRIRRDPKQGERQPPPFELVGLSQWELDDAGQRTWDFEDSWELRTIEGKANCCAFDASSDAEGAPRISQGWTHESSTFLIVRQEQSKVALQCTVLRVYAGAVTGGSPSCEAFLSALAKDPN